MPFPGAYSENTDLIRVLDNRFKKLVVQSYKKNWLYRRLLRAMQVVECYDKIEMPIYLGPSQSGKWIKRGDLAPDAADYKTAMGFFKNRYVIVPKSSDMFDRWESKGNPMKVIDLEDLAQVEASVALFRAISYALINGIGAPQPDGLSTVLEKLAPASQVGVFGGINKATKAWWRNQYTQLTSDFGTIAAGTTLPAGVLAIQNLIKNCTIGQDMPSDLLTTQDIFEMIRRFMLEVSSPQHQIGRRIDAEYGVRTFMFEGLQFTWDPDMPADTIYCLHIDENVESTRQGDDIKNDPSLEEATQGSILDLNKKWFMLVNPNVRQLSIAPRTPYRQLRETEWVVDSINLGAFNLSAQGVAGSDNGSRWSTW